MIKNKIKNKTKKIVLSGELSGLEKARNLVYESALAFGFSENESFQIALAADEACTNIMKHSYHFDRSKKFTVEIKSHKKEFQISILDEGTSFNPNEVEMMDIMRRKQNKQKGGFGIFLITKIMDSIQYFPKSEGYPLNQLILKKTLE